VITRDLRQAIASAVVGAGYRQGSDPGLRPTGTPGRYAASVALTLGGNPRETARGLAARLAEERWIDAVAVTGPGYLTITVTSEALTAVADSVIRVGSACVTSDALAGMTVPAAPAGDPLAVPTWEEARAALAARLAVRLAAAAGATVTAAPAAQRFCVPRPAHTDRRTGESTTRSEDRKAEPDGNLWSPHESARIGESAAGPGAPRETIAGASARIGGYAGSPPRETTAVARAVAFAGPDAVLFTLARAIPGQPLRVEPEIIARHVPGNPAYAVRYAHARAASGVRWAVASSAAVTPGTGAAPPCSPADPGELAFLDALSWLPERVATAARRGRPDEFARYLEDLASATARVLSSASHPGKGVAPGSGRLTLAEAARTGLAAGLGLLEVTAPERLLAET
jgi:arginyl-tRNA synthetase